MKHIKKYTQVNESNNTTPDVGEINELFKIHSYWITGVEFSLEESESKSIINHLETRGSRSSFSKDVPEKTINRFKELAEKYKGFRFENEECANNYDSDYDWESFTIDVLGPNNEHWIGHGQTCPAESPRLDELRNQDEPDEKSKDYQQWLRLGSKWGFK